ncbi:hypothetical protein P7C73_g1326, partial [Tremellales sp. Uapishka_1]
MSSSRFRADIFRLVCLKLASSESLRTLATLQLLCRETYYIVTPLLYRNIKFATSRSALLIQSFENHCLYKLMDVAPGLHSCDTSFQHPMDMDPITRLILNLRYVESVHLSSLISEILCQRFLIFLTLFDKYAPANTLLLPRLSRVVIGSSVLDELVQWRKINGCPVSTHSLVMGIKLASRPQHLCITVAEPSLKHEAELASLVHYLPVSTSITYHALTSHQIPPVSDLVQKLVFQKSPTDPTVHAELVSDHLQGRVVLYNVSEPIMREMMTRIAQTSGFTHGDRLRMQTLRDNSLRRLSVPPEPTENRCDGCQARI